MKRPSQEKFVVLSQALKKDIVAGILTPQQATKRIRKLMGMTQEEFAAFIKISLRTLKDFERGVGNPTLTTMQKIAGVFSLDVKFSLMEEYEDGGRAARKRWERQVGKRGGNGRVKTDLDSLVSQR